LSAAAAAIFLSVVAAGFRHGPSWLLPSTARVEPALTRAELQALVAQEVAAQASLQSKETQAAAQDLVAGLREEETENWARIARQLQYLESAQDTEWKETQQQNEIIRLVARSQQLPTNPQGR
jgi:hypothetical protein